MSKETVSMPPSVPPLGLNDYQQAAAETAIYDARYRLLYPALGLAGEAGEVAGKVSKILRDGGGTISQGARQAVIAELGDTLWMAAMVARDLGYSLEDVARENLAKLRSRAARGTLGGNGDAR